MRQPEAQDRHVRATPRTRAQAFEASEDIGRNTSDNPSIGDVIAVRFNRREMLKGAFGVAAIAAAVSPLAMAAAEKAHAQNATRFHFKETTAGADENHGIAEGYDAAVLMRWGDPVLPAAPAFDPMTQSATAQKLPATTMISSAICRCRARATRRITACWW
jgi:secreted PhoX family phosphatase